MRKYLVLIICILIALIVSTYLILSPKKQEAPIPNPLVLEQKEVKKALPSETVTEYNDPSGFSLSYPDNLSISSSEITDNTTYADIQLSSKEVSGSLNLKISDSKFKTLDEWLKLNSGANTTAKEVRLGNLNADEIKTADRLLLGALDQGILFTIEMPLIEEDFWMKVYGKVISSFSFVQPENTASQATTGTTAGDVVFEGEEVVE